MLSQVIDLGELKFGKPHHFSVLIKNNEQLPVTIKNMVVGCSSCTEAFCKKPNILPSEETKVDIIFTPGVLGPTRKSVTLIYDDSSYKIEFIANVKG